MSGKLSRGLAQWKYNSGEDAGYLQLDEKTPEALLQLGFAHIFLLRSVGGRIWSHGFGYDGSDSEIPLYGCICANLNGKNGEEQNLVGSFSGALSS